MAERARGRRIGHGIALALLLAALLEGAAHVAYRALAGSWLSFDQRRAVLERIAAGAAGDPAAPDRAAAAAPQLALHPYLGFVDARAARAGQPPANALGFHGEASPLRRRSADRYLLAITGGSVAAGVATFGAATLAEELEAAPELAGRTVEVLDLALGGWKQPQQLMLLNWLLALGGELDALVNLDGYNEVSLATVDVFDRGLHPAYPSCWDLLTDLAPDADQLRAIGSIAWTRAEQAEAAAGLLGSVRFYSAAAEVAALLGERRRERALAAANAALLAARSAPRSPQSVGPPFEPPSDGALYGELAAIWSRCSRQMDALGRQNGIRYFHFLQPNQHVPESKPMGRIERAIALAEPFPRRSRAVVQGYPRLAAAGAELAASGIAFYDLRFLFADVAEPLYVDGCCHLNEAGYRRIAARVAAEIRRALERGDRELLELAFAAPELVQAVPRLELPLGARWLDGSIEEVTPAAHGAIVESSAPDVVSVLPDGSLCAWRAGTATVTARYGGRSAVASIRCTVALTALALEPTALVLDDPLAEPRVRARARYSDGSEIDVAGGVPRATFSSSAPGVIDVDADGALWALDHGEARITVRFGDREAAIAVRSALGRAEAYGASPVRLALQSSGSSPDALELEVAGAPAHAPGHLALRTAPPGAAAGAQFRIALASDGAGAARAAVPLAPARALGQRAVWVEARFTDPSDASREVASNGLRLALP